MAILVKAQRTACDALANIAANDPGHATADFDHDIGVAVEEGLIGGVIIGGGGFAPAADQVARLRGVFGQPVAQQFRGADIVELLADRSMDPFGVRGGIGKGGLRAGAAENVGDERGLPGHVAIQPIKVSIARAK